MVIKKGERPNSFTLSDQYGEDVSISDYDGKYILLSFHPLAWTKICAKQMQDLENNYEKFKKLDTIPFGISIDPVPSKKAWAESLGLDKLKILSDFYPLGFAAKLLGVFIKSKGFSGRANILLNRKGEVVWTKEYEISKKPDIQEVLEEIKEVQ